MPRLQVKKLFDVTGRPEIQPQAKASTFAYVTPAKQGGSNDMQQLGEALSLMGAEVGSMFSAQMKKEKIEGLKQGAALATKHQFDILNDSRNAMRQAIEKGWFPHGASAYVKQGYLEWSGHLFATSGQASEHMDEGIEEWIEGKVYEDKDTEDFQKELNSRLNEKLGGLLEQVPNNYYSKDVGFMNGIQPVLDKKIKKWTDFYHTQVSKANVNTLQNLLVSEMDATDDLMEGVFAGDMANARFTVIKEGYEDVLRGYSGQPLKNRDNKRFSPWEGQAPRLTLPPERDQREFQFQAFNTHIVKSIEPLGSHHLVASLEDALVRVNIFRGLRRPVSGERVDAGSKQGFLYNGLQRSLERQLSSARTAEGSIKAAGDAALEKYLKFISASFAVELESIGRDLSPIGADSRVSPARGGKGVIPLPEDGNFAESLIDYLKNGRFTSPSTSESLKFEVNPDDPWAPTQQVLDAWDAQQARINIMDNITDANRSISSANTNLTAKKAANQNELDMDVAAVINPAIESLAKAGEAVTDKQIRLQLLKMLPKIKESYNEAGITLNLPKYFSQNTDLFKGSLEGLYVPSPQANAVDIHDFARNLMPSIYGKGGQPLMDNLEIINEFAKAGYVGPPVTASVSQLLKDKGFFYDLQNFHKGTRGRAHILRIQNKLMDWDDGLKTAIRKARGEQAGPNPPGQVPISRYELELQTVILKEMEKSYTELVRKIGETYGYDSDALAAPLDDAIYRFESTPVLGPNEEVIREKSLANELLTRFDDPAPGNDPNRFMGGGWTKYLLWRKTH